MALWSYLGLLYGVAIVALAWRKERAERWSDADRVAQMAGPIAGGGSSVTSATWESGLWGAAGLGLLTYLATLAHPYPHPIHWLITALGGTAGLGLGLMLATPRTKAKVRGPEASRTLPKRA